jgi:hypothetical protein
MLGERWSDKKIDVEIMNDVFEEKHIPMDANKFAIEDLVL